MADGAPWYFSWFLFQIWVFGIDSPFLFTIVGQTPSDFLHLHPFPNLGSRYSFEEICLERDWGSQTGGIPWSFSGHQKGWQYDCWQLEKCRTWSSHIVSQVWADHSCATQHPEMWAISSSLHFIAVVVCFSTRWLFPSIIGRLQHWRSPVWASAGIFLAEVSRCEWRPLGLHWACWQFEKMCSVLSAFRWGNKPEEIQCSCLQYASRLGHTNQNRFWTSMVCWNW